MNDDYSHLPEALRPHTAGDKPPESMIDDLQGNLAGLAVGGLFLGFGGGILLLAMHALQWLRTGAWQDWTLEGFGFVPPHTQYLGLNKLLAWPYSWDLAALLPIAGTALMFAALWAADRLEAVKPPRAQ
jgi:hypothetical protein